MGPRVRIAPSPTGDPHVGTAYVALFNLAFARKHGGEMVLRIEDTDRSRFSPGSERAIFEALTWLGLEWDEGPDRGGAFGPYRQSERLARYRAYADRLLEAGKAYRCFCTRERLDALRKEQMARKARLGYDGHCRNLDPAEVERLVAESRPHVVRLKVPRTGRTVFHDGLRGEIGIDNVEIDDQVLLKSDGYPTYHLANVVDDHEMAITHVIRGEEWITSTPKHVLLYEAFGWQLPEFYHLGLLRNPDRSKLSKRKNPVSIDYYRAMGYLPGTFLNYLGTLGFSMPDGRERFTLQEMIDAFDWSRVNVGGPVFDRSKLDAWNGDDLRAMSAEAFEELVFDEVLGPGRWRRILELVQPRIARLDEIVPYAAMFFGELVDYEKVAGAFRLKKRSLAESAAILSAYLEAIESDPEARTFEPEPLEAFSRRFCTEHGWKPRELFSLLRVAVAGRTAAPPLFDTMVVCGKDRCRARLKDAIRFVRAMAAAESESG
ncbi:MAG: glutamate--tRNA ligase [Deltaproteobacteria bacterium]|nr:MAG: glutamate--tRNA ligase [Deltaproteobacteria bacterium]